MDYLIESYIVFACYETSIKIFRIYWNINTQCDRIDINGNWNFIW